MKSCFIAISTPPPLRRFLSQRKMLNFSLVTKILPSVTVSLSQVSVKTIIDEEHESASDDSATFLEITLLILV